MEEPQAELARIRQRIDQLDQQILALVSERASFAQRVAQVKTAMGEGDQCYRPEREAQVLQQIIESNLGPVSDLDMARLFREIMSICLALETPLSVAFPELPGGAGLGALRKHFGAGVEARVLPGVAEVFATVAAGACHYGVVPVEAPSGDGIAHTLDLFLSSPLLICGEVRLGQQRSRFLVLGRVPVRPAGRDLTSLLATIADHPGSLRDLLAILARHQVNIQHIESRPGPDQAQVFFMDLEGHREDAPVRDALEELATAALSLKVLGSYPVSVL